MSRHLSVLAFSLFAAVSLVACDGSGDRSGGGHGPSGGNGGNGGGGQPTLLQGSLFLPPQGVAGRFERAVEGLAAWLLPTAAADGRIDLLASASIPADARLYVVRIAGSAEPVEITAATQFDGATFSIDVDEALALLAESDTFADLETLVASRLALRLVFAGNRFDAPLAPDADDRVDVSPVTELLARELDVQAAASDDIDAFFAGLDLSELAEIREGFILGIMAAVQDQTIEIDFGDLEQARDSLAEAGVTQRLNQDLLLAAVEAAPETTSQALAGSYNLVRLGVSLLSNSDGVGAIEQYATLGEFNISYADGELGFELAAGEQQTVAQEARSAQYDLDFVRYERIHFEGEEEAIGGVALAGADGSLTLASREFHQRVTRHEPMYETFDEYFHASTSRGGFETGSGLIFLSDRESSHQRCVAGGCADLSQFSTVGLMVGAPALVQPFQPAAADGRYGVAVLQTVVEDNGQRTHATVDLSFDAANGVAGAFSAQRIAYDRRLPIRLDREFEVVSDSPADIRFAQPSFDAYSALGNGAFDLDLFDGDTTLRGFMLDAAANAFFAISAAVCVDDDANRVQCEANDDDILDDGQYFKNRLEGDGGFGYETTLALGLRLPATLQSMEGKYRVRGMGLHYDGTRNELIALNGGTVSFADGEVTLGPLRREEVLREGDSAQSWYRESPFSASAAALDLDVDNPGRFTFSMLDDGDGHGYFDASGYVSADGALLVMVISGRPVDVDHDFSGTMAFTTTVRGKAFGGSYVLIGSRID